MPTLLNLCLTQALPCQSLPMGLLHGWTASSEGVKGVTTSTCLLEVKLLLGHHKTQETWWVELCTPFLERYEQEVCPLIKADTSCSGFGWAVAQWRHPSLQCCTWGCNASYLGSLGSDVSKDQVGVHSPVEESPGSTLVIPKLVTGQSVR